jgi:hypothetical protein
LGPVLALINLKELTKAVMDSNGGSTKLRSLIVKTLNKFLGAQHHECNKFVSACKLYSHTKHLLSDKNEITFASSRLTRAAQRWVNTYPTGDLVLFNWSTFVQELKKRHSKQGPHKLAI